MRGLGRIRHYLADDEDLAQFRASVERVLQREYDFARHRRSWENGGFDHRFWKDMAELGWFAACLPEWAGGLASSSRSALMLLAQCGRHLVVEPVLNGFLVPAAVVIGADPESAERRLSSLVAGDEVWALAWSEPGRGFEMEPKAVEAVPEAAGWRLSGHKSVVLSAPLATKIIVSAATPEGPTLFMAPLQSIANLATSRTIDGQTAANLDFGGVLLPDEARLGDVGAAMPALRRGLDWAAAAAAAEATGSMEAAFELTLAYDQTRKQFGRKLTDFQVVQHRLSALAIELEYAQSMVPFLAMHLDHEGMERGPSVSAAHWRIMTAAKRIAFDTVQLHGGIGVTHEAEISHHFRKITSLGLCWGDASHHLDRYRRHRQPCSDLLETGSQP